MALFRQIAQLGHPVLRTPAAPVELPASDSVRALIADMLATLEDANGVGIAAPQVYEPAASFIVASRPNPRDPDAPLMEPEVVINPEILERSDELVQVWEGCHSIPGLRGLVPRHRRIRAVSDRRRAGRPARARRRRGADLARWNAGGMMGPSKRMDRPMHRRVLACRPRAAGRA
jgi:peptide deformylase